MFTGRLIIELLMCHGFLLRFRKFEVAQKDIADFLELWDRTTLQVQIPHSPSEPSEEEAKEPPQSAKKGKSKGDKCFRIHSNKK